MRIQSKALRDSARGETCTLAIVGACQGNTETVVLAHLPDESHGMSRKSDDIAACFACADCHDVIDGRRHWPGTERNEESWYKARAMVRTWRRWIDMGLVTVKGVKR
ncbi:nuclease domain-containing protein [Allohahella sp. A8]|uniref:nuclease domain-containing protein n=1 Tax=Allohahella sp. A8 TaxID=3141461 RepID=UPI003A809B2D